MRSEHYVRELIREVLDSHTRSISSNGIFEVVKFEGSGFSPEEELDRDLPEMRAHMANIQDSQANGDRAGERAAILSFLEDVSESLYDEARQGGAPDGTGQFSEDMEFMLNDALELGEYVQRALADDTYDELGWIDAVSQKAADSNPGVGGVWSDEEDYEAGFKS